MRIRVAVFSYSNIVPQDDINLIFDNSMLYNKPETSFYRTAARLKVAAVPILERLNKVQLPPPVDTPFAGTSEAQQPSVGDIEPPLDVLQLLLSSDLISELTDYVVDTEPVTSLFNFEFGKLKPPPPPRPSAPPRGRAPRNRKVEKREKRVTATPAIIPPLPGALLQTSSASSILDASPGFRARATRGARAVDVPSETGAEPGAVGESVGSSTDAPTEDVQETPVTPVTPVTPSAAASAPRPAPPRTRSARALAAAFEADANIAPPEVLAAAKKEEEEEAARLRREKVRDIKRKKRAEIDGALAAIPLVVEPTDNRDTFKMFNQGWVLPAGTARRGRVPAARDFKLPPPKSRGRKCTFLLLSRSCGGF